MDLSHLFQQYTRHGVYLRGWDPKTTAIYQRAFAGLQQSLRADGTDKSAPVSKAQLEAPSSQQSLPAAGEGSTSLSANSSSLGEGTLTKARLEAWVVWMRQQERAPAYINMHIRAINAFLRWLKEDGHVPELLKLKQVPKPDTPIPMFTDRDVQTILRFKPVRFGEQRLFATLALLLDTGARIDEALNIKEADIDFDNLLITIVRGKGSKSRKVPFSPNLRKLLYRYLMIRNKRYAHRGFVFCTRSGLRVSYRNTLRGMVTLCGRLGIVGPRISPHTLRHYFAISYIRNGGDIYRLSRILGHTSVSTTQIYLRSMGVEALGENHSQLSPLSRLH